MYGDYRPPDSLDLIFNMLECFNEPGPMQTFAITGRQLFCKSRQNF